MKKQLIMFAVVLLVSAMGVFAACTDTDGGKDIYKKGTVSYKGKTYTDACKGTTSIGENYCSRGSKGFRAYTFVKCPYGACSNGACTKPVCGNGIKEGNEKCDTGALVGVPCTPSYKGQCSYCMAGCISWANKNSCYNYWANENHTMDVGNVADEAGHNLSDWGPVETTTHGGSWGSSPTGSSCCPYGSDLYPAAYDGTARVVSDSLSSDNSTLEMPIGWGNFYSSQYLEFMALKGISMNDSFDVYIGGNKVYSFKDDGVRQVQPPSQGSYYFDFGTATSPVQSGYKQITEASAYDAIIGYGWVTAPDGSRDRATGTNLTRDIIFGASDTEFKIDIPDDGAVYFVTVYFGDMSYAHDKMSVTAEGNIIFSDVNTADGQVVAKSAYIGSVTDGTLNIVFKDNGGDNVHWSIVGLDVKKSYCPEQWVKHSFKVSSYGTPSSWYGRNMPGIDAGVNALIKFVSTAPHWSGYDTYGQVAISQVITKWRHNVDVCV